jgi:hypothetical protein
LQFVQNVFAYAFEKSARRCDRAFRVSSSTFERLSPKTIDDFAVDVR